jgi:multiple sugar transport system ATP-binding protein
MAAVTLRGLRKSFGDTEILKGIDLEIRDGEFMVFVGPSGCGKTTTLRLIAGLDELSGGELLIGGEPAHHKHPAERGAAMVFQSYALYPHMTVAENMGFALKMAGKSRKERDEAVQRAAETLRITPLLGRTPKELSGGQRQRVAIGRAIVRQPKVFLFDEPLSNLDAALRVDMRIELARLHKQLGTTMIYVTHDQTEAMTLGERIAVFNQGRIEQLAPPLEVYEKPATEFVAAFIGAPRINLIARNEAPAALWAQLGVGESAQRAGLRPEHLELAADGVPATLELAEHLGDASILHLRVDGLSQALTLKDSEAARGLQAGDRVGLRALPGKALAFDDQGRLI